MARGLEAAGWGLVSGSALLFGAGFGYFANVPQRWIAAIMGFGSGVLISALAFELMEDAFEKGGFQWAAIGFFIGAVTYTAANSLLAARGAKHRKRSSDLQPSEEKEGGSGLAIALGALLDGIPESLVVGLSLLGGKGVSLVTVIAIFISNVPEGLSSAAGMRKSGRSVRYVALVWSSICLVSGFASWVGYTFLGNLSPENTAVIIGLAAGAILTMLSDTMIPEACEQTHNYTGLCTGLGFLTAFYLSRGLR